LDEVEKFVVGEDQNRRDRKLRYITVWEQMHMGGYEETHAQTTVCCVEKTLTGETFIFMHEDIIRTR
jgi:hypothetical protein